MGSGMTGGARRLIRGVLSANRSALAKLVAWSVLESLPVLLSGGLMAVAVDRGFLAGRMDIGLLTLAGYGALLIAGAAATRQTLPAMAALVESLRDALLETVVKGSLRRAVSGEAVLDTSTVARLTRQTEMVRQLSAGLLQVARTVVFSMAATIAGLFTLAPAVAVIALPAAGAALSALALLSCVLRRRYRAHLDAEERLAEESGRVLAATRDVIACGATRTAGDELGRHVTAQADAAMSVARAGAGRVAVIVIGARLPLATLLFMAPWLVANDLLSTGELLGAATYLVHGLEPALRMFVQAVGNMGQQLNVTLGRLAQHEPAPRPGPRPGRVPDRFDLSLHKVTFRYGHSAATVLDHVTLDIPHGEHLVVVGPSGTGKSTLANLIAGLDRQQSGAIRLGGIPLADFAEDQLRRCIALVPQESYVFAGTFRENLTYLRPDASDAEIISVLARLGAEEFLHGRGGLDAQITRSDELSAGEKQLLTLARAYLSPAPIVILDEATCHLDPAAEERTELAFRRRRGTLIVIAHRISSAERAGRVLIMENGGLRHGDHESLVRASPLYASLVGHWHA
ncbi:ABC transporter ATP-binding protein [Nonomuraea rubra]